ncbi:helix-turn-helix domain-containing protein [Flavobacterium phycosphaerae]|uniref:helix-turn-helix domain-containing protein n=1 Tax=Flavobacterium phycosphaerae TaxID=2697515 RepID=UPI0013896274|nr:helix-turn-helix transcriptional regulator [Flavobacterium phycosphaerae]
MKAKKERIRDSLGLTQEELSLLLEVGHSRLALHELGARQIPFTATQRLADMLQVAKTAVTSVFLKSRAAEQVVKHKTYFEKLLKDNQYHQVRIARLLASLAQKYQSKLIALHLVNQLGIDWKEKAPHHLTYLGALKNGLIRLLDKKGHSQIVHYQIKLQLLKEEEKLLQAEIDSPSTGLECLETRNPLTPENETLYCSPTTIPIKIIQHSAKSM